MVLVIGIPLIVIWLIIFPAFILYKLIRLRGKFDDKQVVSRYGLYIIGLKDNTFYWEIVVNNIKKVIFIICGTVLGGIDPS